MSLFDAPDRLAAGLLVAAVALGWFRLARWQQAAGPGRSARWRLVLLALLQPLVAGALWLALFPPATTVPGDALVVVTAGAPRLAPSAAAPDARRIALPEAPRLPGDEAFPDLGAALRRYPATRRLHVVGQGLVPRDRDSAAGRIVRFVPAPLPGGIIALSPPGPVAPGADFAVSGTATGQGVAPGGQVELVDPAGRVTDRLRLDASGGFVLAGTARVAGTVQFGLRLRAGNGALLEEAAVPVLVTAPARPRLLILAGAPGPEVKFLRRWATDAGFSVQTQIAAGGGISLGDPPIALTPGNLATFAVAVVDERAWAQVGGARAALLGAVRGGLGLLLRADGEEGTRALWRSLGLTLRGTGGARVALPAAAEGAEDTALARTRRGIVGADRAAVSDSDDPYLPELGRLAGAWQGPDLVPYLPDAAGRPLAAWRPLGAGRIGAFAVADSHALALSGHADLFAGWWSRQIGTLARPVGPPGLVAGPFRVGERASLCAPGAEPAVERPDGSRLRLIPDRAAGGCAAFWPDRPGWHRLLTPQGLQALFVHPAAGLPALFARRDRDATVALAMGGGASAAAREAARAPGSPWPWFVLWLVGGGLLWWFERSPRGRGSQTGDAGPG